MSQEDFYRAHCGPFTHLTSTIDAIREARNTFAGVPVFVFYSESGNGPAEHLEHVKAVSGFGNEARYAFIAIVPNPIDDDESVEHLVSIFVDTKNRSIVVHDPLYEVKDRNIVKIPFPAKLRSAIESVYQDYTITEECTPQQLPDEESCTAIAMLNARSFAHHQGPAAELHLPSREGIFAAWPEIVSFAEEQDQAIAKEQAAAALRPSRIRLIPRPNDPNS